MAVQVLGKVAYFNKGAYNSQTNYEINDVVSYNGSSYVSLNDNNQGNLPTNTNYWSVVAEKGDKGDTGKPFVIEKTYSSIESMVADYDNMNVNDYVMIQGSIEEQENATLWTKREVEVAPYKWAYLADFSGASGITGATPNIHIGNVTEGNEPSVTRRSGSSNENPILDFVLKTGAKGDTGATGNGISSIEKTSTSGLVDTYTITFTNGTSTTIEVTNGRGIVSIAKTGSVDYVDTYTITYNDGTTSTFEVANSEVTEEEFDDVVDELSYLYDDLPKVEGEGTNLTLDNTRKGKMSTMLKGNLSQKTNIITYTCLGTETGDYYFVYNSINYQFTMPTISANDVLVFNTDTLKLYLDTTEISTTTASTGTLITMNTTPNPDYPQDIQVVSGDNTIKVEGKNLLPITSTGTLTHNGVTFTTNSDGSVTISGTATASATACLNNDGYFGSNSLYSSNDKILKVNGTYTYSSGSSNIRVIIIESDTGEYQFLTAGAGNKTFTYTGTARIGIRINSGTTVNETIYPMLEKGSTATTYQPYESGTYPINLGTMELCKIGNYQDYIAKSTGKNLFESDYILAPSSTINAKLKKGVYTISTASNINFPNNIYFKLFDSNGNIITTSGHLISNNVQINFSTTSYSYYGGISTKMVTFTLDDDYQLSIGLLNSDGTIKVMLNEGATALPYEPFGKGKWYKHSEIGKVVLDGSESWTYSVSNVVFYTDVIRELAIPRTVYYCNRFFRVDTATTYADMKNGETKYDSLTNTRLIIKMTDYTITDDFKQWLSTHDTSIYYILATPTNTEITDQTLIAQLDNFEKAISYNTQTNISQENNDLPFIISASAFMSLKYIFGNLETRVAELEG